VPTGHHSISSESPPRHHSICSTHGYRKKKTRKSDLGPEGVSDNASTNQQSGKNQSELILLSKSSSGHLVPEELGKNYSSPDAIDFNWNKQPVHSMVLPRQIPG